MAPVTNQINIDLGDQVAGSIQKRLLRFSLFGHFLDHDRLILS
jgi:hypothetical protein